MKKYGNLATLAIVLFAIVLTGCAEVKTLPPLDKKMVAEDGAVLIIPENAQVVRINGKKRGWGRSWSIGYWTSGLFGSKAATVLLPAGEHTVIFKIAEPLEGWSARNLENTVTMDVGKMYMLSAAFDGIRDVGTTHSAFNYVVSFIRNKVFEIIPGQGLFPRPNPNAVVYQIKEINQGAFEQYLRDKHYSVKPLIVGLIIAVVWYYVIIGLLRLVFYYLFMGRFKNSHGGTSSILSIVLALAGILVLNYNSSGIISLHILSTILIGAGLSRKSFGHTFYAEGCKKLGDRDYNGAMSNFNSAIALAGYNADYIRSRALVYYCLQDWENAIADLTTAVQLRPNEDFYKKSFACAQAAISNNSGLEKLKNCDFAGAVSDFTNAIDCVPDAFFDLFWIGFCGPVPSKAQCIYNRGQAYCHLKDWGKAIADFTEAVQFDPKNDMYKKALLEARDSECVFNHINSLRESS